MSRRTMHRRQRAQGGCLTFSIGVLTVMALALVMAIVITERMKPPADSVRKKRETVDLILALSPVVSTFLLVVFLDMMWTPRTRPWTTTSWC